MEPPHFRYGHEHQHPDQTIRNLSPDVGRNIRNVDAVGIVGRKLAAHVNQLEICTDQAVGIEAGRLSTLFARLNGQVLVFSLFFSVLAQELLVLVAAIQADEFSTHGVGKYTRAAIVVTRGPSTEKLILGVVATQAMLSSKGGRTLLEHGCQNCRSANVGFVGETGPAKCHVVAGLAP